MSLCLRSWRRREAREETEDSVEGFHKSSVDLHQGSTAAERQSDRARAAIGSSKGRSKLRTERKHLCGAECKPSRKPKKRIAWRHANQSI